jgi:hypothetical protein
LAVLLGTALVARPLVAFLRAGGWEKIQRFVLRAIGASGLTSVVLAGVVTWAHQLTNAQRNGGDWLYTVAFLVVVAGTVASIGLWTQVAVVTARQLALTRASLFRETFLAATTTLTMAVMTVASTIWWTSVYSALPVRMVVVTLVMLAATALAATGTLRSVRALRA